MKPRPLNRIPIHHPLHQQTYLHIITFRQLSIQKRILPPLLTRTQPRQHLIQHTAQRINLRLLRLLPPTRLAIISQFWADFRRCFVAEMGYLELEVVQDEDV